MGEVFRARDTRLGRDVAIKVLPDEVAKDTHTLSRFEHEAKAVAALSHPNILALYDVGEENGVRYAVTELLEGETLREALRRGAFPVRRALEISEQLAKGLAAAHEKGIVHRDVKPENVFLTKGGDAKLLDFGLARHTAHFSDPNDTHSPTEPVLSTAGTVTGTVAYMSPEQARGLPIDHRSDQFSLGIVLYEMLTGRRPFRGDSAPETLIAIIREEPEALEKLAPSVPAPVRWIVERCLRKESGERYDSTRDLARDLAACRQHLSEGRLTDGVSETMAVPAPGALRGSRRRQFALGLGALVILAVVLVLSRSISKKASVALPGPVRRFRLDLRAEVSIFRPVASFLSLSPDGRHIAYVDSDRLRIRDLDRLDSREVPGSEKAEGPFWSPDGRNVAFVAGGFLKRVPVDGGSVRTVCEIKPAAQLHLGGTWSSTGSIVLALGPAIGLFEVSSEGGDLRPLLKPDPAKGIFDFHWPSFLPDGRTLLLVAHPETGRQFYPAIFDGREVRRLLPESTPQAWSAVYSESGYVLYAGGASGRAALYAVPFDAATLRVIGEPFRLIEDASDPSVSTDGALVYVTGASRLSDLVLVNRSGRVERTISTGHEYTIFPRVSPDGKRVLMSEDRDGNSDVWVEDIDSGARLRLTTGPEADSAGAWSSSGERVAIMSGLMSDSGVVLMSADGSGQPERLPFRSNLLPEGVEVSPDWSPDGRFVMFRSGGDLLYGDVSEKRTPVKFAGSSFTETEGRFSPDGRFVAYTSNESGRFEVYVRSFPTGDRKWTVSVSGGVLPRWSRTGNELFFFEGTVLMAAPVSTHESFRASPPMRLFDAAALPTVIAPMAARYDPMPDGRAFVFVRQAASTQKSLVVVENWAAELKRRR
jgi:serine/threonine protein kinase/Tol biopolymer transport system component